MIALNRKMPQDCMNLCPCLQTVTALDENHKPVMARLCAAYNFAIIYMCDETDNPPDEWMNFKKPSWCPWIDMSESLYDKEFEREYLQKKIKILEDGDMFGY